MRIVINPSTFKNRATDEVPETLFGIPVVSADYTEEDLAFFRANPEAGGFYDTEDETKGEM